MSIGNIETTVEGIRAEAESARNDFAQWLEQIDRDPNLSDAGKQSARDEARTTLRTQLAGYRDRELKVIDDQIGVLERTLNAQNGKSSSDLIAFRDAQDRADRVEDAAQAEQLIRRAIRSSDDTLAYAVFRRAIDSGYSAAISAFSDAHPEAATYATDLATLQDVRLNGGFQRTVAYMGF